MSIELSYKPLYRQIYDILYQAFFSVYKIRVCPKIFSGRVRRSFHHPPGVGLRWKRD